LRARAQSIRAAELSASRREKISRTASRYSRGTTAAKSSSLRRTSARFTACDDELTEEGVKPGASARPQWKRLVSRASYESPWQPAWLRWLIGNESFQEVATVSFYGDKVTDDGLTPIEDLAHLREFSLSSAPKVTDAGLVRLARLNRLRKLDLSHTAITVAGLAHLKELTQLEELDLSKIIDLDDAGLVWLEGLKNLRRLAIGVTLVSDAGLAHLSRLPALQELDLVGNEITNAGLAHLRGLQQLRTLYVGATKIDDEGIAVLKKAIPKLVASACSGTNFGATGPFFDGARELRSRRDQEQGRAKLARGTGRNADDRDGTGTKENSQSREEQGPSLMASLGDIDFPPIVVAAVVLDELRVEVEMVRNVLISSVVSDVSDFLDRILAPVPRK
jgi:Leucine Rich repeat